MRVLPIVKPQSRPITVVDREVKSGDLQGVYGRGGHAQKGRPREPIVFGGRYLLFCEALSARVTFLDTAGVHPEVFEAISLSLLATESNLRMASLALARSIGHVVESHLVFIVSPSM